MLRRSIIPGTAAYLETRVNPMEVVVEGEASVGVEEAVEVLGTKRPGQLETRVRSCLCVFKEHGPFYHLTAGSIPKRYADVSRVIRLTFNLPTLLNGALASSVVAVTISAQSRRHVYSMRSYHTLLYWFLALYPAYLADSMSPV